MKQVNILLPEKMIQAAKEIAEIEQVPYTVLFRSWIAKKVREYVPAEHPTKIATGAATTSQKLEVA